MKALKKWDILSKDERKKVSNDIIRFFLDEREEEIGYIQAEEFTDFFMESVFDSIYNKGIEDSQKILGERFQDLQVDLDLLKN